MGNIGKPTKTELCLLGLTAAFLCGLLVLHGQDRKAVEAVPVSVQTEREVPREELAPEPLLVDINTAGTEELALLPGIGPSLAERIVEYRQEHGSFETIEDIMKVSGIGEGKYAQFADQITVEGKDAT